jgi:hypothetical protein
MIKKIKENKLYISKDKETIIIVPDISKPIVFGYNMRTEKFTRLRSKDLSLVDITNVFNFVGVIDIRLIGLISNYFLSIGYNSNEISNNLGISNRTLFRYLKLLEID